VRRTTEAFLAVTNVGLSLANVTSVAKKEPILGFSIMGIAVGLGAMAVSLTDDAQYPSALMAVGIVSVTTGAISLRQSLVRRSRSTTPKVSVSLLPTGRGGFLGRLVMTLGF